MVSVKDAALSGFRIAMDHRGLVVALTLLATATELVTSALLVHLAGPALVAFQAMQGQPAPDPAAAAAVVGQIGPALLAALPFSLAFYALTYAAVSRVALRPGTGPGGYFRLGGDELRQAVLLVQLFLLLAGGFMIGLTLAQALGGLLADLMIVALTAGVLAAAVRLSLASPRTFDLQRQDLKGAWRLTKGQFRPLIATYLLAGLMALIVNLLGISIQMGVAALIGGAGAVTSVYAPDFSSLGAFYTPARLICAPIAGLIAALVWLIMLCPPAVIYRQLAGATAGRAGAS